MGRRVKGTLFLDYVRMLKSRKGVDWSKYLKPEDLVFLKELIVDSEWYPMETFERMGLAILKEIAGGNVDLARVWGRNSIDDLFSIHKSLICDNDPHESLMRFQVLRRSFFDFNAIDIQSISGNYAKFRINYKMPRLAEEAATYQALGYFERLLELSGAKNTGHTFVEKAWEEGGDTILELRWGEAIEGKKVKGILFADYVRMLKSKKDVDLQKYLKPKDMHYLKQQIVETEWYPFDAFERMGAAIFKEVANEDLNLVRKWSRESIDHLLLAHKSLVCVGDPMESLMRFQVLRRSFFDFSAINLDTITVDYARMEINYGMSEAAEKVASYQALGFFERLLALSGAKNIKFTFEKKLWERDPYTILELSWK